ncbi:hypothetical protein CR970_01425 [Candidatus Saccharibacteria bacterium]|nr:MAG: hypothetical protein CR970_01425 [Candidatus Saccharibacteria bacterium]
MSELAPQTIFEERMGLLPPGDDQAPGKELGGWMDDCELGGGDAAALAALAMGSVIETPAELPDTDEPLLLQ